MTHHPSHRKRFGVALGGGGGRAFVHCGVLSVLAEAGINVDVVAGSSMGAILGAFYAFHPDATALRARVLDYFPRSPLFGGATKPARNDGLHIRTGLWGWMKKYFRTAAIANIICARKSLLRKNPAHKAVLDLIPDAAIESARLPFACTALDLTHGELAVFTSGPVRPALEAGSAIGVVFPPYHWDGRYYVDAAPISSVPTRAARGLGADVVLAVDVRTKRPPVMAIQNGFDVISRVESIESDFVNSAEANEADVLLKPDVGTVFWGDFTHVDKTIAAGEAAMREALPRLREALAR